MKFDKFDVQQQLEWIIVIFAWKVYAGWTACQVPTKENIEKVSSVSTITHTWLPEFIQNNNSNKRSSSFSFFFTFIFIFAFKFTVNASQMISMYVLHAICLNPVNFRVEKSRKLWSKKKEEILLKKAKKEQNTQIYILRRAQNTGLRKRTTKSDKLERKKKQKYKNGIVRLCSSAQTEK